jgi:chromosome partitioning protein
MSARIISVAHRKGGIGKTSVTLHLATALALKKGYKVLVFDTDSQKSALEYREFEQKQVYQNESPPYPIEAVQPKYLYDDIRHNYDKYDIIFIDIPRLTEAAGDSQLTTALNYCDSILIPVVAGELEALSTTKFVQLVQEIASNKKSKNLDFSYFGFLNKRNQRKENGEAVEFMKGLGVPMFEESLADVKALARPYTFETVIDSADGKSRFEPFFTEFVRKFEL